MATITAQLKLDSAAGSLLTSVLAIDNTDTGHASQVEITLGTAGASKSLGFLDPDDWAFLPWQGTEDINVKCTSATTQVEWMLIFE